MTPSSSQTASRDSGAYLQTAQPAWRTIAAAALGNGLELFDFTIFSFFAVVIGKLFFPVQGQYGPLLLSLATFGLGFVTRPLGGLVIGHYADRHGRKAALTLTILAMALGTALIGLTPTYAQIGIAAPVLLVVGRLIQGFSAGGEIGTASTYLMESAQRGRRCYWVSWQMASQGGSALIGALFAVALSRGLQPAALEAWGWRVPFLIGLLIAPVGLYMRRHLPETHTASAPAADAPGILGSLLRVHRGKIGLGIALILGGTASMYITVFYMPSYMVKSLHMPAATAFLAACVAGAVLLVVSPWAGKLADRLPRRKPLVLGVSLASGVLIYPAFNLIRLYPNLPVVMAVTAVLVLLMALGSPAGFVLVMEAFPREVRVTALALVYSVGVTLFGGFAQFIVTWLISRTGNVLAPAWYMSACSVVSIVALLRFVEQADPD